MNKEASGIIHYVLTIGSPVGRWETARAARSDQRVVKTVFEKMRCLKPAGERSRNGNSEPQLLFQVDRNRIPSSCRGCLYAAGSCNPKWRDRITLGIEGAPPEDETA